MALTEPGKIITPWATAGLKNAIPAAANPVNGSAGYDLGFPPVTMTPPEAGGIPPQGQDFNGILFSVTEALRYMQAGGLPAFNSSLSSAIGGYAKGAILGSSNGTTIWQNIVDGNTGDPDAGSTGWVDAVLKFQPRRAFAVNDYIRIPDVPGGLIIQWGRISVPDGANDVTFTITWPIAFPSVALAGVGGIAGSTVRKANLNIISNSGGDMSATNTTTGGATTAFYVVFGN